MSYHAEFEVTVREEKPASVSTRFLAAWLIAVILIPSVIACVLAYAVPLKGVELILESWSR